jgi:crossover junction endodeoxyribonuclease RuvC
MTVRVLGVDPGSRHCGWAIVDGDGPRLCRVAGGVLSPGAKTPLPQRLGALITDLEALFAQFTPAALAVEAGFVQKNPRTALVLGQARGLPIALAAARGIPVHEYAPALVKRRVIGRGRADKYQVRHMTRILLQLPGIPPEDEADALAVAIAHLRGETWSGTVRAPATAPVADPRVPTTAQAVWLDALAQAGKSRRWP